MKFDLNTLVRENIKALQPYSCARSEFSGKASVFLDANENPYGSGMIKRYPDPLQLELKRKLSAIKNISVDQLFIGNGSDEAIDLLIRTFCTPGKDKILVCPPTYGMYEVSAAINDVAVTKVNLMTGTFQLNVPAILKAIDKNTKIIFICNPNNPTGNRLNDADIKTILARLNGIVVIDEAYIDFSGAESYISKIAANNNIVVLQTLSKAWSAAGLRIGMAIADSAVISLLNKIKPPYNVNVYSQQRALNLLSNYSAVKRKVDVLIDERKRLANALQKFPLITKVYPSDSNFLLIKTAEANKVYEYLAQQKIVVRNRSKLELCKNCLRITVGTKQENSLLIKALKKFEKIK